MIQILIIRRKLESLTPAKTCLNSFSFKFKLQTTSLAFFSILSLVTENLLFCFLFKIFLTYLPKTSFLLASEMFFSFNSSGVRLSSSPNIIFRNAVHFQSVAQSFVLNIREQALTWIPKTRWNSELYGRSTVRYYLQFQHIYYKLNVNTELIKYNN